MYIFVLKSLKYAGLGTSLVAQLVKNLHAVQETQVRSLSWEDLWRRKWQPTPVVLPGELPGEIHEQRGWVGVKFFTESWGFIF